MNSYCEAIEMMKPDDKLVHKLYHDHKYGFPIESDDELFCRLILEINQAGLSWTTILRKEAAFRKAYHDFNIRKVAAYGERDRNRLMMDPGIIRNRLKIDAAIENARSILNLQREFGSFGNWLDAHHPLEKADWVMVFKNTFRFTGGEIVNEFLVSTGYLPGAHHEHCPAYNRILIAEPRWADR